MIVFPLDGSEKFHTLPTPKPILLVTFVNPFSVLLLLMLPYDVGDNGIFLVIAIFTTCNRTVMDKVFLSGLFYNVSNMHVGPQIIHYNQYISNSP